jgi:hypothetical protein
MSSSVVSRLGVGAAVLALMTGCGMRTAESDTRGSAGSDQGAAVQRMADETLAQLGGTAEQREAAHYLLFRAMNRPYEECMRASGIDFTAEYHTINVGYVPDGTSGTWMGALNRKPSDFYAANAEAGHDDETGNLPPDQKTPEFTKAQDACDETNATFDIPSANQGAPELQAEYFETLSSVEKQLGPIAPYTTCMEQAGIDYTTASDGEEGWAGLYLYLGAKMPRPPLPGEKADEAWMQYLDLENQSLAADAQCRGDQYAKGLELLGPLLRDLRARNADELQAASETWEGYVTKAAAAGWAYPGSGY